MCSTAVDKLRGEAMPSNFGAPPKRDAKPGERFQLGVRVTPRVKKMLDNAAEESGRSLNQETELRIERSFDRQELLPEVLTLAYGEDIAADLMKLGAEMKARRHRRGTPFALAATFYAAHSELNEVIAANAARGSPFWPTRDQLAAALQRHLGEFLVPDWQRAGAHVAEETEEKTEARYQATILQFRKKA
jgi:hypothetical protein